MILLNLIKFVSCNPGQSWLGATDIAVEGSWVFERAESADQNTYLNWLGSNPDNYKGNEHCLEYIDVHKQMNDANCDERIGVSCRFFDPSFNSNGIVGYQSEIGCKTNEVYQRKGMKIKV